MSGRSKPWLYVACPSLYIVIEDGVVKILCRKCFLKGMELPLFNPPN